MILGDSQRANFSGIIPVATTTPRGLPALGNPGSLPALKSSTHLVKARTQPNPSLTFSMSVRIQGKLFRNR